MSAARVTSASMPVTGVRAIAAARDDSVEFEAWVHARGPALLRFAHLVTGGAHHAPDLVQDALASAYPRWGRLARSGTAEAYVRRSIVNASVSRWRRERRVVTVADAEPHLAAVVDPTLAVVERLGDADAAWRLCAALPAPQRVAVVLRFAEDRTYAEIADVLGCREATARSHVHRALVALRAQLAGGRERDRKEEER